jgi:hypothetical protein
MHVCNQACLSEWNIRVRPGSPANAPCTSSKSCTLLPRIAGDHRNYSMPSRFRCPVLGLCFFLSKGYLFITLVLWPSLNRNCTVWMVLTGIQSFNFVNHIPWPVVSISLNTCWLIPFPWYPPLHVRPSWISATENVPLWSAGTIWASSAVCPSAHSPMRSVTFFQRLWPSRTNDHPCYSQFAWCLVRSLCLFSSRKGSFIRWFNQFTLASRRTHRNSKLNLLSRIALLENGRDRDDAYNLGNFLPEIRKNLLRQKTSIRLWINNVLRCFAF